MGDMCMSQAAVSEKLAIQAISGQVIQGYKLTGEITARAGGG
jgi:hypothetical protein